ncbi:MAG: nrfD [Frankiales bacterium]|nr:nrfD [Frankiales bacterium]
MSAGPRDTHHDPTSGRAHGDDGHPGRAAVELAGDTVSGAAERGAGTSGPNTVTRTGPAHARGAEQALTGQAGGRRRKKGDKNAVVPDAEFTSYYGRPIVKASPWEKDIPAYLFLGGVAAGSSLLGAGADLSDRPALRRTGRVGALVALTLSMVALVHDLGRPERFHHMLRVAKPTSPMSVGTWILTFYGPFMGLAGAAELLPRRFRASLAGRLLGLSARPAGLVAAVVAPAVASYTAVLLSDTATPTWHDAHRHLPFVFVGSASAASGGLGMIGAPVDQAGPARRLAVGGALLELAVENRMEKAMGITAEPLHAGTPGKLVRASKALTVAGTLGTLLVGRRSRLGAAVSGAALMAGSACLRFGVFEAGQESARDPRYTVVPQRERVEAGRATRIP